MTVVGSRVSEGQAEGMYNSLGGLRSWPEEGQGLCEGLCQEGPPLQ